MSDVSEEEVMDYKWLYETLLEEHVRLQEAAGRIYFAAHHTPDRPVEGLAEMWVELRDAAGIEPGQAPKPLPTTTEIYTRILDMG